MSQAPFKILITGGGIAGPTLAYWLTRIPTRTTLDITIVERSPEPRLTGQSVDIREAPVKIMELMGIEPAVRACRTPERGTQKVSANGRLLMTLMSTGDTNVQSITSEYEILRGDLARLCTEAAEARPGVRFVYGEYASSVSQDGSGGRVRVEFTNGKLPANEYDLVVGADGVRSRMRPFITGHPAINDLHSPWNAHIAYFTMPMLSGESITLARHMNYTKSRSIWFRPSNAGMGVYLMILRPDDALDAAIGKDVDTQKRAMIKAYEDLDPPDVTRTLAGVSSCTDFYFEIVSQVKAPTWHSGRITLVGDAGYCPSPFSGMGTSSAFMGAYVLAGELIATLGDKGDGDVAAGLARYELAMKPWVKEVQYVWEWTPGFMHPYSAWGVWALDAFCWIVDASKIVQLMYKLMAMLPESTQGVTARLPAYPWAPS